MSEDDIFKQTKDAYLCLIHPVRQGEAYRQEIASVLDEEGRFRMANRGHAEMVSICSAKKSPSAANSGWEI